MSRKLLRARKDPMLLAQTKALDNLAIPIRVTAVQVIQQATALIDHHDQSAARCMILYVRLQMRSQVRDPLAQQCNLHFRRAGVFRMGPILFDQRYFGFAQIALSVEPTYALFVFSSTYKEYHTARLQSKIILGGRPQAAGAPPKALRRGPIGANDCRGR